MSNYAKVVVGMSLGFALVAIDPWNIANAGPTTSVTANWSGDANNMSARCKFKGTTHGTMSWDDAIGNHGGFKADTPAVVKIKAVSAKKVYVRPAGLWANGYQIGETGNVELDYTGSKIEKVKGSITWNNATFNSNAIDANLGTNTGGVINITVDGKAKVNAAIEEEVVPGVNYIIKHVVTCEQ